MAIKGYILTALLFIPLLCFAQEDSTVVEIIKKSKIYWQVQVGVATEEGSQNTIIYRPTATCVIGYKLTSFFQPGVGVGYDEHRFFKSMPVTLWVQGDFLKGDYTPFYYLQGGRATYWRSEMERFSNVHGGEYVELGLGYRWKLEKIKLKLSTGYRKQTFTSINSFAYYWDVSRFNSWPYPYTEETTWELEKAVFKITIEF